MARKHLLQAAILAAVGVSSVAWVMALPSRNESVDDLVQRVIDSGGNTEQIVEELRDHGPAGLAQLLEIRHAMQATQPVKLKPGEQPADPRLSRLDRLIDRVAGQRYACASGLYWYTDFEQAKAAAAASGKPILSLRMLGKLTDEYSCANSRFFRTTLYSNEKISEKLREHFVLHWKSVRPVPRVTIDFGDGRKLERTLTGNSAHYLLAADGQPLDVLPGLYSPQKFIVWLEHGEQLHAEVNTLSAAERSLYLQQHHQAASLRIARDWASDLVAVGAETSTASDANRAVEEAVRRRVQGAAPRADQAAVIAAPKSSVELPIIRALASDPTRMSRTTTEDVWEKIAALPAHRVDLDQSTISIIKREYPTAAAAGLKAISKMKVEDPLVKMLSKLRSSIAMDTVRNEYMLHRQIHDWFVHGAVSAGVEALNERVYAELFLTPSSDPWLGLAPDDTYTALPGGGVSTTAR